MIAAPADARNNVYKCEMKGQDRGWLPKTFVIAHSDGAKSAMVNGPVIHHFHGKPVSARVSGENDKKVTFKWRVNGRDTRGQIVKWQYRATYLKASGKVSMVASPLGYVGPLNGGGTCTIS